MRLGAGRSHGNRRDTPLGARLDCPPAGFVPVGNDEQLAGKNGDGGADVQLRQLNGAALDPLEKVALVLDVKLQRTSNTLCVCAL